MPIPLTDETVLCQVQEHLANVFEDGVVILNMENEQYYSLNPLGSLLWLALETPQTISDLQNHVQDHYPEVPLEQCVADTQKFIQQLLEAHLIEVCLPSDENTPST